jgi:hypothetical protein
MPILLDVPDALKPVAEPVLLFLRSLESRLARLPNEARTDYTAIERELAEATRAIERSAHAVLLQQLDLDAPTVLVEGVPHTRVGRHPATYYTAAGEVVVERTIYRKRGDRAARTVDPVSLRAGVVADGWLPWTARSMAFLLQQGTAREAHATAQELARLPYARASFERVGHALGTHWADDRAEHEQALIEAMEVPAEATGVSVSLDRVSVAIAVDLPRPQGRPRLDAPKRPQARMFRMAWCATVSLHDAQSEVLRSLRYGRMPDASPDELCEALCDDVLALRKKRPDLRVTLLCDGAHELWALMERHLGDGTLGTRAHPLVDLWHLLEKLGRALRVRYGEAESSRRLHGWRMRLLQYRHEAARIRAEIAGWGLEHRRVGEEFPVHEALTFLANHAARMDYATARREGRPVGSGPVEATCKSLFEVRMKRPGARWRMDSGERIVHLRALALSDRWAPAMDLTLGRLRQQVEAAA